MIIITDRNPLVEGGGDELWSPQRKPNMYTLVFVPLCAKLA